MSESSIQLAKKIRFDVVKMCSCAHAQHVASALSIVDIVSVLYSSILHFDPKNPNSENRDYFFLSKGHAGSAIYAALAEKGFFDKETLLHYEENGSLLSGHVSSHGVAGVEWSTGALGHGLPVACGVALSLKIDKKTNRVFVLIGDGENEEGSNWESAAFASHYQLSNLIVIVDKNRMQALGNTDDVMSFDKGLGAKWRSFGFQVFTVNGHNHRSLERILKKKNTSLKPIAIIAKTVKGHGVDFMENNLKYHYTAPQGEELALALKELKEAK